MNKHLLKNIYENLARKVRICSICTKADACLRQPHLHLYTSETKPLHFRLVPQRTQTGSLSANSQLEGGVSSWEEQDIIFHPAQLPVAKTEFQLTLVK